MKTIEKLINYFILGLKTISSNRIIFGSISLLSLMLISIVVYRSITLRNKVEDIENNIIDKIETSVKIDYPNYNITTNEGALYISECLKAPLTKEQLNNNLLNISKELENIFNKSNYNFAFKYKDMYTDFHYHIIVINQYLQHPQ